MAASGGRGGLYDLKGRPRRDIISRMIQYIVKTMAITRHEANPPFPFNIYLSFSPFDSVQSSAIGRSIENVKEKGLKEIQNMSIISLVFFV